MISIKSYLKTSVSLIEVEQYSGGISDPDYIEGAIMLRIDNIELLDLGLVDYIDQLWCYLIEGSAKLAAGKDFFTFFPDQPIELKFESLNAYQVRFTVGIGDEIRTAVTDKSCLISTLNNSARDFFNALSELVPENTDYYKKILETNNFTSMH